MYSMKLLKFLLAGAAFTLPIFLSVDASPIASPQVLELGKRTSIKLYHVASAASAKSIKDHGVKLQIKTAAPGDDFNPVGTGGFYASDSRKDIIEWCKGRSGASAKTNCADVVEFDFDHDASLKVHTFSSPTGPTNADASHWMDHAPDFANWQEFMVLCVHGEQNDPDHKLPADLADGGKTLDLIIGPMESSPHVKQYAFRTTKALAHLKSPTVTPSGV